MRNGGPHPIHSKQIATFKLVGSDAARGNEIKQLI
jgi:hypothetical protein